MFSPRTDTDVIMYLQEISPSNLRGILRSLFATGYCALVLLGMVRGIRSFLGHSLARLFSISVGPEYSHSYFLPETPKFLMITKQHRKSALKSLEYFQSNTQGNAAILDTYHLESKNDALVKGTIFNLHTLPKAQEWVIGIVMLTFALLVSSYLAICQERLYQNHGRHPREAMFYVHSLSLPMFAFMGAGIWKSALEFTQAFEVFGMHPFGDYVSHLWVKLLVSCVMQNILVADSWFIWIAAVIGVSYLLAQSYKNVKHVLKHQIVIKRGDAIAREMNRQLGDDKKMSKKEKDERILWKKNEVGDKEASIEFIFQLSVFVFTFYDVTTTGRSFGGNWRFTENIKDYVKLLKDKCRDSRSVDLGVEWLLGVVDPRLFKQIITVCNEDLKLSRLWELSKVTPKLYDYVMAPLDEDIYARARIVQLKPWLGNIYAFVHFIDEGFGDWVNVMLKFFECLYETFSVCGDKVARYFMKMRAYIKLYAWPKILSRLRMSAANRSDSPITKKLATNKRNCDRDNWETVSMGSSSRHKKFQEDVATVMMEPKHSKTVAAKHRAVKSNATADKPPVPMTREVSDSEIAVYLPPDIKKHSETGRIRKM
ncbi:translocon-associated protein, gamma subunit (TRAP-gamma) domain-containing protein [Ditylenchus destructor]|nr:translocon-associated protein, gamma subunit (TRAP-gamma) domain-containing protein [Ditylenchus destructor]